MDDVIVYDPSTKNWKYISLILLAFLLAHTIMYSYTYLDLQTRFSEVQSNAIESENQLFELESQLQSLSQQIKLMNYSGQSGYLPLPQIYESIKNCIVLITAKIQTSQGVIPISQGSGFVYNDKGYIITNYHVVEGSDELEVEFVDGYATKAEIIGIDPYSDLAVIKVNSSSRAFCYVVLGNSSSLAVGDPIVAIGNPFGLSESMTLGIVSYLGRELSAPGGYKIIDVIQVDAAINPGNSGGPLVNMKGEVVGVNTAIISGSGTSSGVGFAIPSDTVLREIESLILNGYYSHPWLGISGIDITLEIAEVIGLKETKGFLILDITPGSPAQRAGLIGGNEIVIVAGERIKIGGDIIVGVDDLDTRKLYEVIVYLERTKKPEDVINLKIIRKNQEMTIPLTLGERPTIWQ